jgi:hypothetical protein
MPRSYAEARNKVFQERRFETDGSGVKTLSKGAANISTRAGASPLLNLSIPKMQLFMSPCLFSPQS